MALLKLITDRTREDADKAEELAAKGWKAMTETEKQTWLSGLKGAYRYTDWNRVGEAVEYISNQLPGYNIIEEAPKVDWVIDDIPTSSQMKAYLANVQRIRKAVALNIALPEDMRKITFEDANNIEKVLEDAEVLIIKMQAAFIPCGTRQSGQTGGLIC